MTYDNNINIIYADFSGMTEDEYRFISKSLPPFSVPAVELKDDIAGRNHTLGQWLIRKLFQQMQVNYTTVLASEFGKPYIPGGPYFNISHSAAMVIAAFAKSAPVGIDIERIHNVAWAEYESSFSTEDWLLIKNAANPAREMLMHWTRMESIVKADGRGLQVPFTAITTHDNNATLGPTGWFTHALDINGYAAHVTSGMPIKHISLEQVYS